MELIDKQKQLEWLIEFDKTLRTTEMSMVVNHIQSVIESGTFDAHSAQEEIAKLEAELAAWKSSNQINFQRAIQAEQERDALHRIIADGGPKGRNYTNEQFNRLEQRARNYEKQALKNATWAERAEDERDNAIGERNALLEGLKDVQYQVEQSNHPAGLGIMARIRSLIAKIEGSRKE